MKNCISITIVLSFLLLTSNSFSQELPRIVPPTPEAAALSNFTDVPVSHYTGVPNISVPIYTIKQNGIEIPISLGYHARGVMVSETAPRTGMGWSLQYGGSISRQVRARPDESTFYGYLSNSNTFINYSQNVNARTIADGHEVMAKDSYGGYDFYPDQFSFNAGGTSGKFILDYVDGQPVIQGFGDVSISYTREGGLTGKIDSFIIKDANGNTYYYGNSKDGTRTGRDYQDSVGMSIYNSGNVETDLPPSTTDDYYSAWKLMDIETSYGDLISYYYELDAGGGAHFYRKGHDKHIEDVDTPNTLSNISNINKIITRLSKITSYEKQLSKIEFNQGRDSIVFTKSQNAREDYIGSSLDRISVYNGSNLIKAYNLNYSYTTSTDETNILWYFVNNPTFSKHFKRMFLSSIEEEGKNGETLPSYNFTYDSTVLPSVFSSRQDYWGYYNGATDNGPFTRIFEYGNYAPDRRVDTLLSEAGLLKQVKYPTGGTTKLTYEHNKGRTPSEFGRLKLPSINPGSIDEVEVVLTKADFPYNQITGYQPYSVQLPFQTIISYKVECFHLCNVNNGQGCNLPDCIFDFTVNNSAVVPFEEGILYPQNNTTNSGITIDVFPSNDPSIPYNLHLDSNYDFRIVIKYDTPDIGYNLFSAGKRIKKIENMDSDGLTISTKEYEYNFPEGYNGTNSPTPSGFIIGFPAFINISTPDEFQHANMTKYFDATSAYSSFQGNSIGYSSVIEYHGTKENNIGKTEYMFTNISDSGGEYYEFPWYPPTDNEWLRGKNIRTKFFRSDGNDSYSLVKEIYNKYLYGDNEYVPDFELPGFLPASGFIFNPQGTEHNWYDDATWIHVKNRTLYKLPLFMRKRLPAGVNGSNNSDWEYRIYHLTGGTQHLLRTLERDYHDSGTLEKETVYNYNYDKHYQVAGTHTKTSDSKPIITKNYYPEDVEYTSSLGADNLTAAEKSAIDRLKVNDLHRPAEPMQNETYKDDNNDGIADVGELLSRQRTNYKDWGNNNILPEIIQASKGSGSLKDRIEFVEYDSDGNVLEVKKTDGTDIAYIYGYNNTLPIAKIENASRTEIEALSGFGSGFNIVNNLSSTQENNLRNGLSKAMVTTYVYSPLIGVTKITDPSGNSIYYEYDNLNRLKYIKDKDSHILEENKYNYDNEGIWGQVLSSVNPVTNGHVVTLTADVDNGSGNFSYQWTILNSSLNEVTTNTNGLLSITTTSNHEPNFTATCLATDLQTNESFTMTKLIVVNPSPLVINVSEINAVPETTTSVTVNRGMAYDVTVSGGSGNYQYEWSITNSTGTSPITGNSASVSKRVHSSDCTEYTVSCKVTDTDTNVVMTKTKTIIVASGCN